MANGNDIVVVEVEFGPNGVDLRTIPQPPPLNPQQPDLAGVLANIAAITRPAVKASLERAAREISLYPSGHGALSRDQAFQLIARSRDWRSLSSIFFQPELPNNKVKVPKSRPTQLIFYSLSEWTFDAPGLFLDSPLDPAIGTLTEPQIINGMHTVWTTFIPNPLAPVTEFKYNLRLRTDVRTNGVYDGHAIIIVDPIIETSKA